MATTITLSINDQFSQPLDAYAQKTAEAEATTAELAGSMVAADEAAATLTESATTATEAQAALGQAGRSLTEEELAAAAAMDEFAQADLEAAVAADEAASAQGAAAESADVMATANGLASSATMALAGAGIAVAAAMGVAKAAYDNTIGSATALGDEVRKLQFETGATAEQASQLAYAANITGVGVGQLSTAINIATRALANHKSLGIEPNIDGLAKLSDMYLQIQDPIQRNAFLLHEFGRSGADMAPLMALGSAGIKQLGDQATLTGNVLSQQATNQLHAYDMQVTQLTMDTKGLGVALGVELAPAATRVVDGGLNLTHTFDLINAAQKDGTITAFGQAAIFVELATGVRSLKSVYDDLSPKVQQIADDMAHGSDASDRATTSAKYLADQLATASDTTVTMADNTSRLTDRYGVADLGAQALADANVKIAQTAEKAALAMQDQMDHAVLAAGMAGTLTNAENSYGSTVEADAPKLAKLNEEMAKLVASNGQVAAATLNTKYSTDQLDLANNKVQIGSERMQIAEEKLAQAHQGAKESAAAYQTRLEGLRVAVQAAGDAWQAAQISADKMNSATNASAGGIINNTSAIAKLQAQIDPLAAAEAKAKDAIDKATGSIIMQGLAADKNLSPIQLEGIAHSLGLISTADYNLALDTEKATQTYEANIKAGMSMDAATKILTDSLDNMQKSVQMSTDAVLPPYTAHVGDAADKMAYAKEQAIGLGTAIDNLHDKTITITTLYGAGGPGYGPGGGGPAYGGPAYTNPAASPPAATPPPTNNQTGAWTPPGTSAPGGNTVHVNIAAIHVNASTSSAGNAIAAQVRAQINAGIQAAGQ